MAKLQIKKNDTVVVISGESKGTVGKVIAAAPEEGKVIVQGANIVSKHNKARKQGDHQDRRCDVRLQGAARLPQVQQGRSRKDRTQRRKRQNQSHPSLRKMRCGNQVMKEGTRYVKIC